MGRLQNIQAYLLLSAASEGLGEQERHVSQAMNSHAMTASLHQDKNQANAQLLRRYGYLSASGYGSSDTEELEHEWKAWVLQESKRR